MKRPWNNHIPTKAYANSSNTQNQHQEELLIIPQKWIAMTNTLTKTTKKLTMPILNPLSVGLGFSLAKLSMLLGWQTGNIFSLVEHRWSHKTVGFGVPSVWLNNATNISVGYLSQVSACKEYTILWLKEVTSLAFPTN